ncbi:hypothetical protein AC482_06895 [miscellaneous Crenarchaeota group-15 archaeon DG-45]|uniref:Transcription factor Pcc1 n=1 Tax=miscellaneous Crenarchaeota group-15 archaeon DG-45 TaxID=1685127 RepID=A0A0M0BL06_9ARCH|nr:MAG: hypothetical protein AC482_06895 [miscellaneous Crenarchaeota group-15 archaeon DG-45]
MKNGSLAEEALADIDIEAPEELVNILIRALRPETERPSSDRSTVSIGARGRHLSLRIWASDISALRAALNSYLRWAEAALNVLESARPRATRQI